MKGHNLDRVGLIKERGEVYFDFERLKVYQRAIDFCGTVFDICKELDNFYHSSISDQLKRVVLSITTNIAEGCGKKSRREKIKYFSYALDSAKECIPCLTVAYRQRQLGEETNRKARDDCTAICRMLGKLIQSVKNEELRREGKS